MKLGNFIDNIGRKIDLFIKRLNKKRKIYLEDEISKIDFLTGQKVEKISPNSYVINLKKVFQRFTEAKHKLNLPYVYKKNNGVYIGSNTLTLTLIYEALKDLYGETIFILTDNKAKTSLFIYDIDNYKIVEKDEDYQIAIEDFFQGLKPLEVNIYDAIYLVTQKVGKKLIFLLLFILGIVLIVSFSSSLQTETEEDVDIPEYHQTIIEKNKQKITKEEFNKKIPYVLANILANNYFISKLFNNEYVNNKAVIINKIYFKQFMVEYISLIPIEGFKYDGKYYKKKVRYVPDLESLWNLYKMNIIKKDSLKCEKEVKKYTQKIIFVEEKGKYKIFKLNNEMSPQEFSKFLSSLFSCPIVLEGKTDYDLISNIVKNNILIKIYY